MVRPRIRRKIQFNPDVTYFKPRAIPLSKLKEVSLEIDELEAVRLCDLAGLGQTEASERMEISQSTFQRTLSSARKKIAEALVSGKAIKIYQRG